MANTHIHTYNHSPAQAIQYAWQLSTEVFQLPEERIWVSVFEDDDEAYQLWLNGVGVPAERIKRMDGSSNFWASGATGVCMCVWLCFCVFVYVYVCLCVCLCVCVRERVCVYERECVCVPLNA
jgi:hypothetical protein